METADLLDADGNSSERAAAVRTAGRGLRFDTSRFVSFSALLCDRKRSSCFHEMSPSFKGFFSIISQETGRQYPLIVKLGTITTTSGDVFSYASDEDATVRDPLLPEHLARFGVDIQKAGR